MNNESAEYCLKCGTKLDAFEEQIAPIQKKQKSHQPMGKKEKNAILMTVLAGIAGLGGLAVVTHGMIIVFGMGEGDADIPIGIGCGLGVFFTCFIIFLIKMICEKGLPK